MLFNLKFAGGKVSQREEKFSQPFVLMFAGNSRRCIMFARRLAGELERGGRKKTYLKSEAFLAGECKQS